MKICHLVQKLLVGSDTHTHTHTHEQRHHFDYILRLYYHKENRI